MDKRKKDKRYQRLFIQIEALLPKGNTPISAMSSIAAILYHKMDNFFWCGFYLLEDGKLNVGPYQGPVACQELEKNKGVCWAGINEAKTIVVPDVELFPGHIACDSRSKSEIVVPLFDADQNVIGVLDVDSKELNSFDEVDAEYLEKILDLIHKKHKS
jgi:L-methionine (R)-S-oxide reductase